MVTYHTYANNDELRDYLAGTSYSSNWTADAGIITRILEASSKRIDSYVGMISFGARTDTRYYDIGSGTLRHSRQTIGAVDVGYNIGPSASLRNSVVLDDWLISATTVTSYKATDRSESETLTEGYNNDYWLLPYNESPKTEIQLNEDTAKSFHAGQQTLAIAGEWGYQDTLSPAKTTTGTIATTTETAFGVNDASDLAVSQTIKIGSEQMYITGISSNTLTVIRGVNGTTATAHSASTSVYVYVYPSLVVQATLDLAKLYYRDRDMGITQTLGTAEMQVTRASSEMRNVLKTLDVYKAMSPESEVVF